MLKTPNNKIIDRLSLGYTNKNIFSAFTRNTMLLAFMIISTSSFADSAMNYGDINDEDGKYVSWDTKDNRTMNKASYNPKSAASKSVKIVTKKVSEKDLLVEREVGFGDLHRDEE